MSERPSALGVFDTTYFPEISDERSSYLSPLTAINQKLRRKNVVAAAAVSGPNMSIHDSSDPWGSAAESLGSEDPLVEPSSDDSCACKSPRRGIWGGVSAGDYRNRSDSQSNPLNGSVAHNPAHPTGAHPPHPPRANHGGEKKDMMKPELRPNLQNASNVSMRSHGEGGKAVADSSGPPWAGNRLYRLNSTKSFASARSESFDEPQHAKALLQSTPRLRHLSPASTDMHGAGKFTASRNFLSFILPKSPESFPNVTSESSVATTSLLDYSASLVRDRANQLAASELASLLWVMAHEMSLEAYGTVESEVFTSVFALVHESSNDSRMAGLAALDALIDTPSADEEKKAIKFANALSNGLRSANGDFEFLSAVSKALGHMAMRTANVDFVESEISRALEWLRTERSDRRLAASLSLKELAIHTPTAFNSKTSQSTLGQGGSNEFLDYIFQAIRDPQPIVRACAADALSQCLKILVERQHMSLTGLLCQVYFALIEGLEEDTSIKRPWNAVAQTEASQHGSLLVVATMLAYTRNFMLPRFDEVCTAVLKFADNPRPLIRLEVVRLIPRLAHRCPGVFGRRYLEKSLMFVLESASAPTPPRVGVDIQPSAFTALGKLILAMTDTTTGRVIGGVALPTVKIAKDLESPTEGYTVELSDSGVIYDKLRQIFDLVRSGLNSGGDTLSPALQCAANLVEALGDMALPYITDLINDMFRAGLSTDLIQCLHAIAQCVPAQQRVIEDRLLQEISLCLAGMPSARDICDPLPGPRSRAWRREVRHAPIFPNDKTNATASGRPTAADTATEVPHIVINTSEVPEVVKALVLSLQTLGSFGGVMGRVATCGAVVPLLPFVQNVAARYLSHPASEVRRAAALTCCVLLVPETIKHNKRAIGSYSGVIIEDVLETLLRVAVSDASPVVRLCIVRGLDSRYDPFLCQAHHLQPLFLLLRDEALATRAAGLKLLGRLTAINAAPILPVLRSFLVEIIVELQCGVDNGRGREEATRLLVVFLRAKSLHRLIHPVLHSLVPALPLNGAAPRLASAALEALGELALAAGPSLQPWVKEVVPHILETMQDQSSTSKQRTSLRTLGQISGSTGYVITPYLDYPHLLSQATDVLPGTKRAPWSLRREVIRTLGILGALDPDRYHTVASKTRKGGAVGGAYFEEQDDIKAISEGSTDASRDPDERTLTKPITVLNAANAAQNLLIAKNSAQTEIDSRHTTSDFSREVVDDDDLPAHLSMYEQYAMIAQPVSSLPPARRMTPSDDEFYPTVAIQALMRIFRDPSLAVHYGMVIQAIMFIFKSMGLRCVPYLSRVVPHMILSIRTDGPSSLRESLLKQVATLSEIVREHLRPYVADIFDVVEQFWSSRHLGTIFTLVSKIAVGVPDEFRRFAPRLIRRLLISLDELQVAEWSTNYASQQRGGERIESEKLGLILRSINNLRGVLGDYLHMLVPALLKLSDSLASLSACANTDLPESALLDLHVLTLQTTSALLECHYTSTRAPALYWGEKYEASMSSQCGLPARVVQPLVRLLREKPRVGRTVGIALIDTLCVCARQIGGSTWVSLYHDVVRATICSWQNDDLGQSSFPSSTGSDQQSIPMYGDDRHITGLSVYDEVVREMLASPLQRNPTNSFLSDGFRQSQGHELLNSDARQLSFISETPNITGAYEGANDTFEPPVNPSFQPILNQSTRQKLNHGNLQRAWNVSQLTSRDDWDEWMRRFAIQLLREAPSPALRATANLAHAYQPLARELFSAAFVCCWKELSEAYRANLVHSLETAFVADVSPEILQTLLNLAEFMEHDSEGGLPIDITILAALALKCRAYAKALHYKEREHSMGGDSSCVEALISINRKLDLHEAALGVLKSATMKLEGRLLVSDDFVGEQFPTEFARQHQAHEMFYSVIWSTEDTAINRGSRLDLADKKESWLAKLGSWTEALDVYQQKLMRYPRDFEAILGCMRCLDAIGEWRQVLELAEKSWQALSGTATQVQDEAGHDGHVSNEFMMQADGRSQKKALRLCSQAAWRLGRWDDLEKYASELHGNSSTLPKAQPSTSTSPSEGAAPRIDFDGAFFSAVLHIHRREWTAAAHTIDAARKAMDSRFTALMAESYPRGYPSMVTAQTLAEMEEIIHFRKIEERSKAAAHRHPANKPDVEEARNRLLSVWRERLAGCRVDADVHASVLAVRSLVLGPLDEVDATLTLSDLSRQAQRFKLAERVLLDPLEALNTDLNGPTFGFGLPQPMELGFDISGSNSFSAVIDQLVAGDANAFLPRYGPPHKQLSNKLVGDAGGLERMRVKHRLYFAYLKHLWFSDRREEAMRRLSHLTDVLNLVSECEEVQDNSLRVACFLELGEWKIDEATSPSSFIPEPLQVDVLSAFKRAILLENCGYRAWHAWALLNFRIALQISGRDDGGATSGNRRRVASGGTQRNHVVAAVRGFVNAINLGTKKCSASVQQDMLNLLTCLFKYGELEGVAAIINYFVGTVAVEAWLGVLPQLLARIHIKTSSVRSVLLPLLTRLGERHPQALMYPLSVLLKSPVGERKNAAETLMNSLKAHSSALVEEALMVSSELIRVAILWLETWHEGLEDASRLYFGEGNVLGMLDALLPLHEKLEKGPETRRESDFIKSFGQDLAQAHNHIKDYVRLVKVGGAGIPTGAGAYDPSGRLVQQSEEAETAMNKAWDIYYTVFRRINKQLPSLTKLELDQCSPALSRAQSLELGVPGSYRVDGSYVKIEKFVPNVQVITSKQRPRKITLRGSDGKDYVFLLKGHEDLRQDERVMQLFGLVNALLERDPQTKKHGLKIQRYAISPLSHNCGIVGWVPHCDTLHSLIRDYRQTKKIPLNMENREMLKIAPDYDLHTVMQKVEVFTEALRRTTGKGNDLYEILWLRSTNSEEWLERRTKFTRSLAVMSMVGYILGLGDRHPSNLMLDKLSGRVLHIDFGDCFEVAMNRDKYPEKVPFRLTRMLVKAMEVSGIEGSYRSTCERTMAVLRDSRDSLVAMLEAFVYDPLISWRLVDLSPGRSAGNILLVDELAVPPVRHDGVSTVEIPQSGNGEVPRIENSVNMSGIPIDIPGRVSLVHAPIVEDPDEDGDNDRERGEGKQDVVVPEHMHANTFVPQQRKIVGEPTAASASRARSLQMYSNIQTWAANLSTDNRIASITGERSEQATAEGSLATSRIERSMRQKELFSLLAGEAGTAHEEALNEKALKVIRRVQDKLTGTDFPDREEPLDVNDQVQRLIVQATSCENLCQLFIGWCAFW